MFIPFLSILQYKLSKRLQAKIIYEVRDIWPLSLIELSGIPSWHPFVLWLSRIEKQAYMLSDAVVSLLPKAYEHMGPLGLKKNKFYWIPNGVDRQEWEAPSSFLPAEHQRVFEYLKRHKKLIVVYAGSHGEPNALDQIFDIAYLHKIKMCHIILFSLEMARKRRS